MNKWFLIFVLSLVSVDAALASGIKGKDEEEQAFIDELWGDAADNSTMMKEFVMKQLQMRRSNVKKKEKTPDLPSSTFLLVNSQKMIGKVYRVFAPGTGIMNVRGLGDRDGCDMSYVNFDNGSRISGMAGPGDGSYRFESNDPDLCASLADTSDDEISGSPLVVKMVGIQEMITKTGQTLKMPLLEIIKRDR